MTEERVTVVVPTRNRWTIVGRAVESALRQDGVHTYVVVVDDASEETAPASLRALLNGRGQIVRLDSPSGVSRARNIGLAHATSVWTAFLDDDDIWAATKIAKQVGAARRSGAVFACCGLVTLVEHQPLEVRLPIAEGQLLPEILRRNMVPGPGSSLLARTETLRALRGFDERLAYLEDWDLCIRLAEIGRLAAVFEPLVAYRLHPDNTASRHSMEALEEELEYMAAKHDQLLRANRVVLAKDGVVADFLGQKRITALLRARQLVDQGHRVEGAREYIRATRRFGRRRDVLRAAAVLAAGRHAESAARRLRRFRAAAHSRLLEDARFPSIGGSYRG